MKTAPTLGRLLVRGNVFRTAMSMLSRLTGPVDSPLQQSESTQCHNHESGTFTAVRQTCTGSQQSRTECRWGCSLQSPNTNVSEHLNVFLQPSEFYYILLRQRRYFNDIVITYGHVLCVIFIAHLQLCGRRLRRKTWETAGNIYKDHRN
jgi:hypothetical protein